MNPVASSFANHTANKRVVYDAIVVGLGGVGSFALRSLARCSGSGVGGRDRPPRVLGLERFNVGHELGSSHGATRLYRHAYFEHPDYVPLCLRSTEVFRELARGGAEPLLHPCGMLVVSDGGADGDYDILSQCEASARIHGIPVRALDSDDLRAGYGSCFRIPSNSDNTYKGLLEQGAGFVRPELAVRYALDDALDHGANVREGVAVTNISIADEKEELKELYAVATSDGQIHHSHGVVVTVGAWASKLVPELDPFLRVTRQIQAWFELSPNTTKTTTTTTTLPPVGWYLDRAKDDLGIYGIPADPLSGQPGWSKIALHGREVPWDPDDFEVEEECDGGDGSPPKRRPNVTEAELDELRDAIADWIPEAVRNIVDAKACLYTMTPDEDFVLDRCDKHRLGGGTAGGNRNTDSEPSNVWYAAGLSGHGFKMAPALGEALADLVTRGETDLPVGFLRKDRLFGSPPKTPSHPKGRTTEQT